MSMKPSMLTLAYGGLKIGIIAMLIRIAPVTQVMYIPVSAGIPDFPGCGYDINSTHVGAFSSDSERLVRTALELFGDSCDYGIEGPSSLPFWVGDDSVDTVITPSDDAGIEWQ